MPQMYQKAVRQLVQRRKSLVSLSSNCKKQRISLNRAADIVAWYIGLDNLTSKTVQWRNPKSSLVATFQLLSYLAKRLQPKKSQKLFFWDIMPDVVVIADCLCSCRLEHVRISCTMALIIKISHASFGNIVCLLVTGPGAFFKLLWFFFLSLANVRLLTLACMLADTHPDSMNPIRERNVSVWCLPWELPSRSSSSPPSQIILHPKPWSSLTLLILPDPTPILLRIWSRRRIMQNSLCWSV